MAVKSKNPVKKVEEKSCGFCVYVGPTILGVIQSGTIYCGTKAECLKSIENIVSQHPLVKTLVVPGEDVAEARIKTKTPGNLLYVNYRKLATGKN